MLVYFFGPSTSNQNKKGKTNKPFSPFHIMISVVLKEFTA